MALKYLKTKKVVHRDIKPSNIFYDEKRDIVLLGDFGIAHFKNSDMTKKNNRLANFLYHAPEQGNKGKIGHYTDIFSLGLIINEMFTNNIPKGKGYDLIQNHCIEYYYLDSIVETMILNDVNKRCNDITEIIEKIKFQKNKNIELINNINEFAKEQINQLNIKNKNKLIKQLESDLFRCFVYMNGDYSYDINSNYHCNISYSLNKFIVNQIKIIEIEKIAKEKFKYESNCYSKDAGYKNLNLEDEEQKKLYDRFYEIILILNNNNPQLNYKNSKKALKLFSSLCDYHAKELLKNAEEILEDKYETFTNAPLFWIANNLKKYKNILFDSEKIYIFDYLSVIEENIKSNIEQDDFEEKDLIRERVDNTLKKIFPSIQFEKDNSNPSYTLIFKRKRDCFKFLMYSEEYQKSVSTEEVTYFDIKDLKNSMEKIGTSYYFELDNFLRYSLIDRILQYNKLYND